ncbi:MAG: IS21 family transposase [Lachnospiraceae bacterium]|nr:IS21 family transposase [Lachnospiraceae bacterium]
MLDYKDIIIKHYALKMSGSAIAKLLGCSKSGVNDFLRAFKNCESLSYPLPEGITNYGIAELVYGKMPGAGSRDQTYELPDFEAVHKSMVTRKNMTLVYLWNRYVKRCEKDGLRFYQYRQFCELYSKWCNNNAETLHIDAVIGQKMEVDFAGQTFDQIDSLTGEAYTIVVFVAVLPYSQYIYAEGMLSTKEPQWIEVNNHALEYFGGVPPLVVCDNCKQAVLVNKDWIDPELNKDYAEWAEHNHTVILPAKVKKPRFKSSVENAVGILEKGFFHDLEERTYFSLEQFNEDLWEKLDELNHEPFSKKEHNRYYYWEEEKLELMPLPSMQYQYMERKTAKVSSDFHVRFDNAYYSVDKAFLHKKVLIKATASKVFIHSQQGELICEWPRAVHKGQWMTDQSHLPANYKDLAEWNGPYFISRALTVGPCTVEVIKKILASRNLEVQTYRLCLGVLGFTRKYSRQALEECCSRALSLDKVTYTFIKNSIPLVAEELGTSGFNTEENDERNKGAFIMDEEASDTEKLLSRSRKLLEDSGKEAVKS